jgi:hypothetical protein
MSVDFIKVFRASLRYPLRKDAYLIFFVIQIILGIAGWLVSGYLGGDIVGPDGTLMMENMLPFMVYLLPLAIAGWVVMVFLLPAYMDNSAHFCKGKRKAILESFEVSRKRFLPTLAVFVILGLILLACFGGFILLVASVPIIFSPTGMMLTAVGTVWTIAGLIIGIIVAFTTFLSPVFCVLEKQKPLDSIKKSWKLVKKNKASTLIFFVIFFAVYLGIAIAGALPEIIFAFFYDTPAALSPAGFSLMVVRTAVNAYLMLFVLASLVSYYFGIKK